METTVDNSPARILVIDDELAVCRSCAKIIKRRGHEVAYVTSGRDALKRLQQEAFDVVVTDLKMADLGGMEVLRFVRDHLHCVAVVVISGYATISAAVETMRLGAVDFLPKPFTAAELTATLNRAIERSSALRLASSLASDEPPKADFAQIVGRSPGMLDVYRLIEKVAPTRSPVLILGESGTGKELVAHAIHGLSARKTGKFVSVDCSALAPGLVESELFGHEKGAFTGAAAAKVGLFELAHGGTVFIDEIGNLEPNIQVKLLRVLQESEFMRVGGTKIQKVDIRMVFATNRDLKKMAQEGSFREDLYYRLDVFPICIPPLRERKTDIPALCYHFLKQFNASSGTGKKIRKVSDDILDRLNSYDWPGNVRELANKLERMAILASGEEITLECMPASLRVDLRVSGQPIPANREELKEAKKQLKESAVRQLETEFVLETLKKHGGNITRAAEAVGMQRQNFQALMRKHDIHPDDYVAST